MMVRIRALPVVAAAKVAALVAARNVAVARVAAKAAKAVEARRMQGSDG
jgi:hypothetical protein